MRVQLTIDCESYEEALRVVQAINMATGVETQDEGSREAETQFPPPPAAKTFTFAEVSAAVADCHRRLGKEDASRVVTAALAACGVSRGSELDPGQFEEFIRGVGA